MVQNSNIQFKPKPIIGLLGGCGPLATLDIERKLLSATSAIVDPLIDQNYYPMVVYYNTQLIDRSRAKGKERTELVFQLKSSLDQLLSLNVSILLVTCQSAHVFLDDIQSILHNKIFVSMIDVTIKEVMSHNPKWKRVGLIGTDVLYGSNLYQEKLKKLGVDVITPSAFLQKHVMQAIYSIKAYGVDFFANSHKNPFVPSKVRDQQISNQKFSTWPKNLSYSLKYIKDAINYLKTQEVDGVIMGCTELPLLLPYLSSHFPEVKFLDPNQLSAQQVVLHAYEMENDLESTFTLSQQTQ